MSSVTEDSDNNENADKTTTFPDLKVILQQVADQENLHDCELIPKSTSERGDGYMGIIDYCQIRGITVEGKPKVLDVVVKSAHTSRKLREVMPIKAAYISESYHYEAVHPKFRQIQKDLSIPDAFDAMVKCFLIDQKDFQEFIVMQNLYTIGYNMWNRRRPMNEEHVIFVLQHYGKLHAMSYALKQIDEEAFQELVNSLKYNVINDFVVKSENALMSLIDKVLNNFDEEEDALLIERVSKFKSSLMTFILEESVKTDQYSVISHGDCWTNNMMFRYEDRSEPLTPSSMYFIDWQCSRLCPPGLEVAHFFLCNSGKEQMDNADKYLQIYYESLSAHLRKFGGDPQVVLPYEELLDQYKRYCRYGLALAYFVVKIQILEPDDVPDLAARSESGANPAESFNIETDYDEIYYRRIKDIVGYLVDNDLL